MKTTMVAVYYHGQFQSGNDASMTPRQPLKHANLYVDLDDDSYAGLPCSETQGRRRQVMCQVLRRPIALVEGIDQW
jgi:hypothetical protein